ncbi:hypothetical protein PRIPAC_77320 [Pristionchus pacificus]|uniref:Uncharacterized protein n=1 Tax=Pristionchus pacificus TaxID=54126 RepID=A0A2A6BH17_PRIPA|nr:hypothetical protein PRIPAC_77320 [Pristionchus pacificus]|eukprot:PDM65215.1 hypothetical protein PRIPAC_52157 [Pristionchus pacificus]
MGAAERGIDEEEGGREKSERDGEYILATRSTKHYGLTILAFDEWLWPLCNGLFQLPIPALLHGCIPQILTTSNRIVMNPSVTATPTTLSQTITKVCCSKICVVFLLANDQYEGDPELEYETEPLFDVTDLMRIALTREHNNLWSKEGEKGGTEDGKGEAMEE